MGNSDNYTTLAVLQNELKAGETICALKNNKLIMGYKEGFIEFNSSKKSLLALMNLLKVWDEMAIMVTNVEKENVTINETDNPYIFELKINKQLRLVTIPELKSILKILKDKYDE